MIIYFNLLPYVLTIRFTTCPLSSVEFTVEPEAIPERPHRQTGDGEAEVGDGVQGLPGVRGRVHEYAGEVN